MKLLDWVRGQFSVRSMAAMKFKAKRADYYEYLADLMEDAGGGRNLSEVFRADARRYVGTPRGVLSRYWAESYQENGADLAATWDPDLPAQDVMVIRVSQAAGGTGIIQALRDVARVSRVIDSAIGDLIRTIAVGLMGMSIALGGVLAVPYVMFPQLAESFSQVPHDEWGQSALSYEAFANGVAAWWFPILMMVVGLIWWIKWALPNYVGGFRPWLDQHILVFRLYRDFRGALFMAVLASLVKKRKGGGDGLRLVQALAVLGKASEPWMYWHIERIIEQINRTGGLSAQVFDTGLLDSEILFYMADLIESKGFDEGLSKAGLRTEQRATTIVGKRAAVLRWGLLIVGLVTVGVLGGWTFRVILEMKDVLMRVMS